MRKLKFLVLKLTNILISICFCLLIICLITFSNTNLLAVKAAISLWINAVVPSLLPFFIATELLSYTKVTLVLSKLFNKIMRPIFNVPGEGSFALILGSISGYPVGAKIVSDFKKNNICTEEECERLLAYTNNSGPLFILGTVGVSLFGSSEIGFLLLLTHILASFTVGFLFRWWHSKNKKRYYSNEISSQNQISISNLGTILSESILSSINTILMIGGFMILFAIVISILKSSHLIYLISDILQPLFTFLHIPANYNLGIISGIIELTNGINLVALTNVKNISTSIIICAFLLGFGGFSVLLQVLSITSKSKISIKPYIIGKVLQACFAALYTYLSLKYFSIFNLNL